MERLHSLIQDYVSWTESEKGRKNAFQVVFSSGTEDNRPEHDAFYQAVGAWAKDFASSDPDQIQRRKALEMLLFAASEHKDSQAEWYLIAIQNWAKPLIAGLEGPGRESLGEHYAAAYPKSRRLPVQTETYQMLTGEKRKILFFRKK